MLPDNALGVAWAAGNAIDVVKALCLTAGVEVGGVSHDKPRQAELPSQGCGERSDSRGVGLVGPVLAVRAVFHSGNSWIFVGLSLKWLQTNSITCTTCQSMCVVRRQRGVIAGGGSRPHSDLNDSSQDRNLGGIG
ncbi:hypothetical protein E2C01_043704 [Portunus trituberculatus]|uniref:Uncharacterized protein n=1 Tax=Portunus trituberculatus TaxID=210409 RepID=A0A5B7FQ63_PORTR|nr:hypothetical protein [Portunus trituberculatus]